MQAPSGVAPTWPLLGLIYGVKEMGTDEYRYVGLTTKTLRRRRTEHFSAAARGRKSPFASWLLTHSDRESAYFRPLEVVMGDDLEALGHAEQRWIAELRAEGHRLLNLTEGGLGPVGHQWSGEQREAARIRSTGRRGMSLFGADNPMWGRTHSDEQKARWSRERQGTNAGEQNPNYGKFGAAHPSYGHTMTEAAKKQLSESRMGALNPNFGKSASAQTREKMSAARRGRPMPSSVRSAHTRHHTNQGVFKDTCTHCQDDLQVLAKEEGQE